MSFKVHIKGDADEYHDDITYSFGKGGVLTVRTPGGKVIAYSPGYWRKVEDDRDYDVLQSVH